MTSINDELILKERKILLLLDNFKGHEIRSLSNIRLLFLTLNTASILQPLDLGVISVFKKKYSEFVNNFITTQIVEKNLSIKSSYSFLSLLDVCNWIRLSINQY
ncbi:Tigger transposable element-derived protein 1 [Dictyocoela muelleri]|nr:Tigger transposable element-derived protein 1 [Dictyocoela muelleri]